MQNHDKTCLTEHPAEQTPSCKSSAGKFPKFSAGTLNFSAGKILGISHLGGEFNKSSEDFKNSSRFVVLKQFQKVLSCIFMQLGTIQKRSLGGGSLKKQTKTNILMRNRQKRKLDDNENGR